MAEDFNEFLEEIRQKNDIVSVVSRYVPLERKGRSYWCRCPFHGEKTPSLCINDVDNFYYCFGCHVGGNVFNFVMNIESISFMEAVKLLAEWANIEMPESFSGRGSENIARQKKEKDRLYALMKETARHYHSNLVSKTGEKGMEYLRGRQIPDEIINRFGLGFSGGYNELPAHLMRQGFTKDEMIKAGVVKVREKNIYDPLAGRIIFPIIDVYGNVIAFGGRTLERHPDFAKYLNTSDTDIFSKRNTLYAINYLKKQRTKGPIPYVIMVEGYIDTIALHKAGFTMTVASMGTALTASQAKLIKRFADRVYISYDGDSAGQAATIRGLDILRENGLDVFVIQLPDRFDPDDVIRSYGREGYQKCIDSALPLVEFKLRFIKSKYDLKSVDSRAKFLNEAIGCLAQIKDSVERGLYIPLVSDMSQTSAEFIKRELDKKLDGQKVDGEILSGLTNTVPVQKSDSAEESGIPEAIIKAEKSVLNALLHEKPYAHFKTDVEFLFSGARKEIYRLVRRLGNDFHGENLISEVFNEFEDKPAIAEILNIDATISPNNDAGSKQFKDCVSRVYENYLKNEKLNISQQCDSENDKISKRKLAEKINEIDKKLKNINLEEL